MKRRARFLLGFAFLTILAGGLAWQWEPLALAITTYRLRSDTTSLPPCDRVEIFHLKGGGVITTEDRQRKSGFSLAPHTYFREILGEQSLAGAEAESFAALWRSQTFDVELQALCHAPAFGLRFYANDKLLFETSLCFQCSNFSVPEALGGGYWGFDTEAPAATTLLTRLREIFPDLPKPR